MRSGDAGPAACRLPPAACRLPPADGSVFLVTGGNAGIGYFVAEQLSATGETGVLGSRNPAKADAAMASIRVRVAGARVRAVRLDLADPSSLRSAAKSLGVECPDAVVHNAGVALDAGPRRETDDGHEPAARVVTTGSFAAKSERLDLDDLQSREGLPAQALLGRSKLAQMYFGVELDRRLRAIGSTATP